MKKGDTVKVCIDWADKPQDFNTHYIGILGQLSHINSDGKFYYVYKSDGRKSKVFQQQIYKLNG